MGIPNQAKSDLTVEDLKVYEQQVAKQKEQEKQAALLQRAESLVGQRIGSCVLGVRYLTGVGRDQVSGAAKTTKTNSTTPSVGAIIVTNESWWGHVGVVLKIEGDRVYIWETNYRWNGKASTRWISTKDKKIKGYKII